MSGTAATLLPLPSRVARALELAQADATRPVSRRARSAPSGRVYAMGDPQAPLPTVLGVLDSAGLLGDDGRLVPTAHLVSIGDHFDWGAPAERPAAARDGLALLSWLAAHPPDRVTLVLGNHDLGRVGELAHFRDDAEFARARAEADAVYRADPERPGAEEAFRDRHPRIPTSECLSRDLSGFEVAQRERVADLLRSRRFRVAVAAAEELLLIHAGLTLDDARALGLRDGAPAPGVAERLDACLDAAIAAWDGETPLAVPGLHRPGNASEGEARGIFSHRPAHPEIDEPSLFAGRLRRRFDPRRLIPRLTQVVGHSADARCRRSLAPWVDGPAAAPGQLRGLVSTPDAVRYAAGLPREEPSAARLVFIDGGMARCAVDRYELLDVGAMRPRSGATVGR